MEPEIDEKKMAVKNLVGIQYGAESYGRAFKSRPDESFDVSYYFHYSGLVQICVLWIVSLELSENWYS